MSRLIAVLISSVALAFLASNAQAAAPHTGEKLNIVVGGQKLLLVEDPKLIFVWHEQNGSEMPNELRIGFAEDLATRAVDMQTAMIGAGDNNWARIDGEPHLNIAAYASSYNHYVGAVVPRHAELRTQSVIETLQQTAKVGKVYFVPALNCRVFFDRWVFVVLREGMSESARERLKQTFEAEFKVRIKEARDGTWYLELASNSPEPLELAKMLGANESVRSAESTFGYLADSACNGKETRTTPQQADQAYLSQMRVTQAWQAIERTNDPIATSSVRVAVLDTGVDLAHPALANATLPGKDLIDGRGNGDLVGDDASYHGTACAGLIAAQPTAASTFKGIGAAAKTKVISYRVATNDGLLTDAAVVLAFDAILDSDASTKPHIVSCSFSVAGLLPTRIYKLKFQGLENQGVLVVGAAGNDGNAKSVSMPWGFPSILAVGAVDSSGKLWDYSQGVNEATGLISLVAPSGSGDVCSDPAATGVWTTDISGPRGCHAGLSPAADYCGLFSRTSAATAMVSGVAALIQSVRPELKAPQIRCILEQTADKVPDNSTYTAGGTGRSPGYGYGLVNAERALARAIEKDDKGQYVVNADQPCQKIDAEPAPAVAEILADEIELPIGNKILHLKTDPRYRVIRVRRDETGILRNVLTPGARVPQVPVYSYQDVAYFLVRPLDVRPDWIPNERNHVGIDIPLDLTPLGGNRTGWFTGDLLCSFGDANAHEAITKVCADLDFNVISDRDQVMVLRPKKPERPSSETVFPALRRLAKIPSVEVFPDFPKLSREFND